MLGRPVVTALLAATVGAAPMGGQDAGPPGRTPHVFPVRDFGAVGDARTDDAAAFRAAIAAAAPVGGTVSVPPVAPGGGYVLSGTLDVPPGVSVLGAAAGMPFVAWEGVRREQQTGAILLPRFPDEALGGPQRPPLFVLHGGTTIRGLYILYDDQPWPSDAEFDDPDSPYRYESLDALCERFIRDHVRPYGPTFYLVGGGANVTLEDLICARYTDFFVAGGAGKLIVDRIYLFGYGRAFAFREARDVIRLSRIHLVPNVEGAISWQHAKLHAAITAQEGNIAFDFGSVDGYSLSDATVFLAHTGVKLGASQEAPFSDPVTGETGWDEFRGPWGSIENLKLDNVTVGLHCVSGTILPNQLANVMIHQSIAPRAAFAAAGGPVGRQAAILVGPDFAGATLQVQNLSLSSFAPTNVVATAAMAEQANGRAFLVDAPPGQPQVDYAVRDRANVDIHGLVLTNIPPSHWYAATPGTLPSVMVRGFYHNGVPQPDGLLGVPP